MGTQRTQPENIIWILILLLAAGLRLGFLHLLPLNDAEAALALQAERLAAGRVLTAGDQPLYLNLTAALFFLFGPSAWLARFIPALAGVLVCAVPWLMRAHLGSRTALILAMLLAVDPAMVSISSQAGTAILAILGMGCAVGGFLRKQAVLLGAGSAIFLLGGPLIWSGLIGLGVALLISGNFAWLRRQDLNWRRAWLSGAVLWLGLCTFLMVFPSTIAAWGNSLTAWLGSFQWIAPSGLASGLIVFSLSELFPLALGLTGLAAAVEADEKAGVFLGAWLLTGLVIASLSPGLGMGAHVWAVPALLLLAAYQINRLLAPDHEMWAVISQTLISALLLLMTLNLLNAWQPAPGQNPGWSSPPVILAGAVLLLALETALVSWGWSKSAALKGLQWGLGGVLLVIYVSAGSHAAGLADKLQYEPWRVGPALTGAKSLLTTLDEYQRWRPDYRSTPEIRLVGVNSPAVSFLLRENTSVTEESALPSDARAEFLITRDDSQLSQTQSYSGQLFLLSQQPQPGRMDGAAWVKWLLTRRIPDYAMDKQVVLLWVRSDLFPGGANQITENEAIP